MQVNIPDSDKTKFDKLGSLRRQKEDEALGGSDPNADVIAEMKKNRRVNSRTAGVSPSHITFATGRPRDPMFYWEQNNLPYDYTKEDEIIKIRQYARRIYTTHPIIGSAIDVYSKYPLTGMELICKDPALTDFYSELFFEQLDYEEFLVDIGREYWTVGEAWPFGSFNETLGVWEDDELLNPDDIDVIKSPFLKDPRFEMKLPETLRLVLETGQPQWEYGALMRSYPELKNFVGHDRRMPVSSILLKQLKFKADTFYSRGLPILMRGFRAIMQEEMLNAAQDAIADRLYTPLILARLGASATDLGTSQPWIPQETDLSDFEEALDAALAADFRVLTHHFAVQMDTVFGRENMPNMNMDFDRLTDRQLQVFGLSKTMLSGASQGETYAADAINRDLISQLLSTYQRILKKFFTDRASVVAEAQEHFDYEERGGKRYVIMEEVLEIDEETGEQKIVEQPKLLVPDLHFKAMTMKDEQDQRQFLEALRASGVPISMRSRLVNVPIDLDDEYEQVKDEQVEQAVQAQEARKATYLALKKDGLPIPDDLQQDFGAKAMQAQDGKAEEQPVDLIGTTEPADTDGLVPTLDDSPAGMQNVVKLPTNRALERTRPPESDEMRATMPKYQLRTVESKTETDEDGEEIQVTSESWTEVSAGEDWNGEPLKEGPNRLLSGPQHVGSRRFLDIDKDTPLDEWEDDAG